MGRRQHLVVGGGNLEAELAGALHDPAAALILCQVGLADYSFIDGRNVDQERLTTAALRTLVEKHTCLAKALTDA